MKLFDVNKYAIDPFENTPMEELQLRIARFRKSMEEQKIDAFVGTSYSSYEYLAGHLQTAFDLHARPLFVILTQNDFFVLGSPSSERVFSLAPRPFKPVYYNGFQRDGAFAVADEIKKQHLGTSFTVAIDYAQDNPGRGVLELVDAIRDIPGAKLISGEKLIWDVRAVKSEYEAALKMKANQIVDIGFDRALKNAYVSMTEIELFNEIRKGFIEAGAERADAGALIFGRDLFVYGLPPAKRKLQKGDYVWGDFYPTFHGCPADRCRIAYCGEPTAEMRKAYKDVHEVTIGVLESIRPGMLGRDIYAVFDRLWKDAGLPPFNATPGRIGHTSGFEITEPGSVANWSEEVVREGMIFHVEPKLEKFGGIFQFEEIVYVRKDGVEFLCELSPEEMPVIG